MKLMKKINEWQRENIIDDVTAEKIVKYEQSHSKNIVLWAFGGMGSFAIIVGLVSVIAANWSQIPDSLKLASDLLMCLLLATTLYWSCTRQEKSSGHLWLREVLVVVYYGFVLASMALIGQTYQLGGSVSELLLVWTLVTIPLVLLARGNFITLLWLAAMSITYVFNVEALHDFIRSMTSVSADLVTSFVISLYVLGPLFFMLISRIPWLLRERELMAEGLSRYSWFAVAVMGFIFQFLWYENIRGAVVVNYLILICSVVTALVIYFIPKMYSRESPDKHLAMRVVLSIVLMLGIVGAKYNYTIDLVGAVTNLFYLCVLAWAAIKIKNTHLFNIVTAIICIRILIIYFEVFGSMLDTGIGLIVGGVLTLLISWWWFKRSNRLALRLGQARG